MLDTQNYQFVPPFKDSKAFESFTEDLFNELHSTQCFQRRSRQGQDQDAYDVFCNESGILVECKLKSINYRSQADLKNELLNELAFYSTEIIRNSKTNGVKQFYLLSTFPDDRDLQNKAKELSTEKIKIFFWGWDKILNSLGNCPRTYNKYRPDLDYATLEYYEKKNLSIIPNSKRDNTKSAFMLLKEFQETFFPLITLMPNSIQNSFPFNNADTHVFSRKYFLDIKNIKIKTFLQGIELNDGKLLQVDNNEITHNELESILDICAANLYYYIDSNKQNVSQRLPIIFEVNCKCPRCNFYNLDFDSLLPQLHLQNKKLSTGTDREKLKYAYVNFKVGNFKEAYSQLKYLKGSSANNHEALKFIVDYNLQNLYFQIDSDYNGRDKDVILNEITTRADTLNLIRKCTNSELKEQLKWIDEDSFLYKNSLNADKAISKINDSIAKKYSAQSSVDELLDFLANAVSSIQTNFLFYDIYTTYELFIEKCLDALVGASTVQDLAFTHYLPKAHPIPKFQFNNFLLELMIFHCSTDKLKQIFDKYDISFLHSQENNIIQKLKNLLKSFPIAKKMCRKQVSGGNYFFENRLERIIANLFLVSSKIPFSNTQFKEIPDLLVNFIKKENTIAWFALDTIKFLITQKKNETYFEPEVFERLINISYKKAYGKHGLLQTFSDAIATYHPTYKLKSNQLSKFIMQNYSKDKFRDLISLWHISNVKAKNEITKFFIKELDVSFDGTLFFYLAFNKLIDYSLFLEKYILEMKSSFSHWNYERVGDNFGPNDFNPNYFISMLYKLNVDCNKKEIQELAVNDYFKWLLNLETFNYSNFKLEWIGVYDHWSYFSKLKTIKPLKEKIENLLKENYDPYIAKLYYKNFF